MIFPWIFLLFCVFFTFFIFFSVVIQFRSRHRPKRIALLYLSFSFTISFPSRAVQIAFSSRHTAVGDTSWATTEEWRWWWVYQSGAHLWILYIGRLLRVNARARLGHRQKVKWSCDEWWVRAWNCYESYSSLFGVWDKTSSTEKFIVGLSRLLHRVLCEKLFLAVSFTFVSIFQSDRTWLPSAHGHRARAKWNSSKKSRISMSNRTVSERARRKTPNGFHELCGRKEW